MIYLVRVPGTDCVKIGYTRDAESFVVRLQALQTGQPWRLEVLRVLADADQWVESVFHRVFAAQHTHGEWFTYIPLMMEFDPRNPYVLRRHAKLAARRAVEDLIETLVGLLDEWTPDPDAEGDEDHEVDNCDDEPDANEYVEIPAGMLIPAASLFYADDDLELTEVEIDA